MSSSAFACIASIAALSALTIAVPAAAVSWPWASAVDTVSSVAAVASRVE